MSYHIVIVGAGFAGVYAYKHLVHSQGKSRDFSITVINPQNYFLFTPMLHEVATGNQRPLNVVEPLRSLVNRSCDRFLLDRVVHIDPESKKVRLQSNRQLSYDYLLISAGAETEYFEIPGAQEHSFTLKSLEDAYKLKNHCIQMFERASQEEDESRRKELLQFVIVGGGATGVELAAEMAEFFYVTFARYYSSDILDLVNIRLVQSNEFLVPQFPRLFHRQSLRILRRKGVGLSLKTKVKRVTKHELELNDGEVIPCRTVIWTAGIKPKHIDISAKPEKDHKNRIVVDEFLRAQGMKDIFVAGDMSASKHTNGKPLPATAQVAVYHGKIAAKNILACMHRQPLRALQYRSKGQMLSLGRWFAIGKVGPIAIWGFLAWWMWRTIYLFKLLSWSKRFRVMGEWTINLFAPRDISKMSD